MLRKLLNLMICLNFTFLVASADSPEQTDLGLRITKITDKEVFVVLTNTAKQNVKIWDDGNSWGAGHWRILILSGDQFQLFYQSGEGSWSKNAPEYKLLSPGQSVDVKLNFHGWIRQGNKGIELPGDLVVVSYDVHPTEEAINLGVWYGVVAAVHKNI